MRAEPLPVEMARAMRFLKDVFNYFFSNKIRSLRYWRILDFGRFSVVRRDKLISSHGQVSRANWPANKGDIPDLNRGQQSIVAPRSVVFLHNNYYTFYYLARALRKRGWDAVSVCTENSDDDGQKFYHGNDVSLYDPSPMKMQSNIEKFFTESVGRFKMVHFYGRGLMSFFPSGFDTEVSFLRMPVDFIKLKQAGIKIGYSVCGCLDGVAQSTFSKWSGGCCDRCIWQDHDRVCSDKMNLAWGHKYEMFCDLVSCEGFPALDYQSGPKTFREPLTTALDEKFWNPNIVVPDEFVLPRKDGELIVYHAVGNFDTRSNADRNIKGTRAVIEAIKRLQAEGMNVRLEFVQNMPSTKVRFLQVQADVIIDQLNHGRYGASAREGMMLGRPTICYINKKELPGQRHLKSIEECPLVSADEGNVYEVLRDLLLDEPRRKRISIESRAFALKWHSADACAERFEAVYDRLLSNLPPEIDCVSDARRC